MQSFGTIRTRLVLLVMVNVAVIVGLTVGIVWFAQGLFADNEELPRVAQRQSLLSSMKTSLGYGGAIHHFKNYVLRQEPRYVDAGNAAFVEFTAAAQAYRALAGTSAAELDALVIIEATMQRYVEAFSVARDLFVQGASVAEVDDVIKIDDGPAIAAFDDLALLMEQMAQLEAAEMEQDLRVFLLFLAAVGASGLILVSTLSTLTSRVITKRLSEILGITNIVARGDLSHMVQLRGNDEIGALASNFNHAIENLRSLIGQVQASSGETVHFSDVLRDETEAFSDAIAEIVASIHSIDTRFTNLDTRLTSSSAATEEILHTISSLAKQIASQADVVRSTSAAVEQMTQAIENVSRTAAAKRTAATELVEVTDTGGQKIAAANGYIQEISRSVDGIVSMISVINDVAAQTNLLSMNAAIEAAHAGDAGRGFGVVADEIRKLAVSTAGNAETISSTLSTMVDTIQQAQTAGVASGSAFDSISDGVRDVAQALGEISGSSQELSAGSQEVLRAATDLVGIADGINSGAAQMEAGAHEINDTLLQVKDISNATLQGLREIGTNSNTIAHSIERISSMSQKNEEHARVLRDNVAKFHIGAADTAPELAAS